MKKFEFDISIPASTQVEATEKMKALVCILNSLTREELIKVAQVVSNPVQLSIIKAKLL